MDRQWGHLVWKGTQSMPPHNPILSMYELHDIITIDLIAKFVPSFEPKFVLITRTKDRG